MIVAALATLITAIFLGGAAEIFYVDNLEKGIKKHVVEKERKNLDAVVNELLKKETLDKEDFEKIVGKKNSEAK